MSTVYLPLCDDALRYLDTHPLGEPDWQVPIGEARATSRADLLAGGGRVEDVASVELVNANGVPARIYWPSREERTVLVWFHGGAWMFGDLDTSEAVVSALANAAHCAVLSVDYRLAPEHVYPSAVDDCWSATTWALDQFDRVAVGGDSSGGNLAAVVALRARDEGKQLALQLLIYPVLDWRPDSASYLEFRDTYRELAGCAGFGALAQESNRHIWNVYIPDARRRSEPYASPLRASSLESVAPALIINAEHDILRGEGEEYACRLRAAGVPVMAYTYLGQLHGFFDLLGVMRDARNAVQRAAGFLKKYLFQQRVEE
ncbi:MAG: alpha/beta hydrolase [Acidimicrobiales bacterium]